MFDISFFNYQKLKLNSNFLKIRYIKEANDITLKFYNFKYSKNWNFSNKNYIIIKIKINNILKILKYDYIFILILLVSYLNKLH